MVVGPSLAPHRPGTSVQAPVAGQAGSSTAGSFALALCWYVKGPAAISLDTGTVQYREPSHAWRSGGASIMLLLAWPGLVGLAQSEAVRQGVSAAVRPFGTSLRAVLEGVWRKDGGGGRAAGPR